MKLTAKAPKFVFRIRKKYFDSIVIGEKREEYRRDVRFWQVRLANVLVSLPCEVFLDSSHHFSISTVNRGVQAIFICGKRKHIREIIRIERRTTPEDLNEQGRKDISTATCLIFHLGRQINKKV